jgi:hypothetical protein
MDGANDLCLSADCPQDAALMEARRLGDTEAAETDDPDARLGLARLLERREDLAEAEAWFRRAAETALLYRATQVADAEARHQWASPAPAQRCGRPGRDWQRGQL